MGYPTSGETQATGYRAAQEISAPDRTLSSHLLKQFFDKPNFPCLSDTAKES
jgi:hypothetical protein